MQNDIQQRWFFEQTPETVWNYLTDPRLLATWLMDNDFQPILGHHFRFWFTPGPKNDFDGNVYCEVLEIAPPKRLVYSWKAGPAKGEITVDSTVIWTLTAKDNGTELELWHTGFIDEKQRAMHEGGWNSLVGGRLLGQLNQLTNATTQS